MARFLTRGRGFIRSAIASGAAVVAILALLSRVEAVPEPATPSAPPTLRETGLYIDAAALTVDPQHLTFSPQYPLWTDGAAKRRWISLPPGTAIDASDPDAWVFPVGTRLWKEFSFDGRRVETRYLEREADRWVYAAYAWSEDGREAHLVGARGRRAAYPLPGGKAHAIPGSPTARPATRAAAARCWGSARSSSPLTGIPVRFTLMANRAPWTSDAGRTRPRRRVAPASPGPAAADHGCVERPSAPRSATCMAIAATATTIRGRCECRPLPASEGARGSAGGGDDSRTPSEEAGAGPVAGRGEPDRAGLSGKERIGAAHRLPIPCPSDAPAGHRAGRP